MNKPVYLGLSILDLSKNVMYEFCYDYVKPKYGDQFHCSCKNRWYLTLTWFDTSNFEIDRPLPRGKNKKVIWLMKDELG